MLTVIISSIGVLISLFALVRTYWNGKISEISDIMKIFASSEITEARNMIGVVVRRENLDGLPEEEDLRIVNSIFKILWAIQILDLIRKTLDKTAITPLHGKWLYQQLEVICKDINTFQEKHSGFYSNIDVDPSYQYAKEVIEKLPKSIKDSWGRKVIVKNFSLR